MIIVWVLFMVMKILDKNCFFFIGMNLLLGVILNKIVLVLLYKWLLNLSYVFFIVLKIFFWFVCVLMVEVKNGCLWELKILLFYNKYIFFYGIYMFWWCILYYWYFYIILYRVVRIYSIGMIGYFFCNLILNGVIYGVNR